MRQGSIAIDATARLCENLPVLTVALTVCRKCLAKHNVNALPYVVRLVDAFLNRGSGSDSVVRGCNQGFSVHMLEYIAAHDVAPFWKEAAVNAAANGHVHVLQWLSNKHVGRCEWGANVMDTAARYGHLEAVQWLHDYRGEGCTTDAMDWAICRGDVG